MISKVVQKKSNMTADPSSYGMTDTMGRMHSDAQFAGMTLPAQRQTQRHSFGGVSFLCRKRKCRSVILSEAKNL